MKRILIASSLLFAATQTLAGNIAEPMMEPEVVEAATGSSGGSMLVPILLLLLLAAAVANGGGDPVPQGDGGLAL